MALALYEIERVKKNIVITIKTASRYLSIEIDGF
jgi:hypothetical protein